MKTPRIIIEWDCDGIGCAKTVQVEITGVALADLDDAALARIAEWGGLPHAREGDVVLPGLRRSATSRAGES